MNQSTFDALVRRAATGLDRRSLLAALGIPVVLTAIDPLSMKARKGKKGGKGHDKDKKKKKKDCPRQEADCFSGSRAYCSNTYGAHSTHPDPELESRCLDERFPCCILIGKCKQGEGNTCLFNTTL